MDITTTVSGNVTDVFRSGVLIGRIVTGMNLRTQLDHFTPSVYRDGEMVFLSTKQATKAGAFGIITGWHARNVS